MPVLFEGRGTFSLQCQPGGKRLRCTDSCQVEVSKDAHCTLSPASHSMRGTTVDISRLKPGKGGKPARAKLRFSASD